MPAQVAANRPKTAQHGPLGAPGGRAETSGLAPTSRPVTESGTDICLSAQPKCRTPIRRIIALTVQHATAERRSRETQPRDGTFTNPSPVRGLLRVSLHTLAGKTAVRLATDPIMPRGSADHALCPGCIEWIVVAIGTLNKQWFLHCLTLHEIQLHDHRHCMSPATTTGWPFAPQLTTSISSRPATLQVRVDNLHWKRETPACAAAEGLS